MNGWAAIILGMLRLNASRPFDFKENQGGLTSLSYQIDDTFSLKGMKH